MGNMRNELDAFLSKQQELGCKRRDIALVLFARGYTESQVGRAMTISPRSAAAMKVDFSKAGKEKREKTGKRVHLDPSIAQLKRVNGQKMLTKFLSLVDAVLESDKPAGVKEDSHE